MKLEQKRDMGQRLKGLRLKADLSQIQVAEHVGVDRVNISNYEIGRATPKREVLLKLADLYKTTTDYILGTPEVSPEKRLIEAVELELSDDQILKQFNLLIDGSQLSKEEFQYMVSLIRTKRQMNPN